MAQSIFNASGNKYLLAPKEVFKITQGLKEELSKITQRSQVEEAWDDLGDRVSDFSEKFFLKRLGYHFFPNQYNECVVKENRIGHWCPYNHWEEDQTRVKFEGTDIPAFIIDKTTDEPYFNGEKSGIRLKCGAISLGMITGVVPLFYFLNSIGYLIYHLCKDEPVEVCKDLVRIILLPVILSTLFIIALYGILSPHDGRKLYATVERVAFCGHHVLATCFQPYPIGHFFGSSVETQNGF